MASLTPEILNIIHALQVFPVATATSEGVPNVIYVAFLRVVDDETIEIADNRFHKTRQNLEANPILSILLWSPECTGAYQVKGGVTLHTEGPIYEDCVAWVHAHSDKLTPKAAVRIHIQEIYEGATRLA